MSENGHTFWMPSTLLLFILMLGEDGAGEDLSGDLSRGRIPDRNGNYKGWVKRVQADERKCGEILLRIRDLLGYTVYTIVV